MYKGKINPGDYILLKRLEEEIPVVLILVVLKVKGGEISCRLRRRGGGLIGHTAVIFQTDLVDVDVKHMILNDNGDLIPIMAAVAETAVPLRSKNFSECPGCALCTSPLREGAKGLGQVPWEQYMQLAPKERLTQDEEHSESAHPIVHFSI